MFVNRSLGARIAGVFALGLASALFVVCGDDDDDAPLATEAAEEVPEGVVEAQPDNSTRVNITLREWAVVSDATEVEAGTVYFLVENEGPDDPHEFLVLRTDLGPGDLPVVDGRIPEDEVDVVDEIEAFQVGTSASIAIDLPPGNYLLLCNIAEIEEGELESHFELGMRVPLVVR